MIHVNTCPVCRGHTPQHFLMIASIDLRGPCGGSESRCARCCQKPSQCPVLVTRECSHSMVSWEKHCRRSDHVQRTPSWSRTLPHVIAQDHFSIRSPISRNSLIYLAQTCFRGQSQPLLCPRTLDKLACTSKGSHRLLSPFMG